MAYLTDNTGHGIQVVFNTLNDGDLYTGLNKTARPGIHLKVSNLMGNYTSPESTGCFLCHTASKSNITGAVLHDTDSNRISHWNQGTGRPHMTVKVLQPGIGPTL